MIILEAGLNHFGNLQEAEKIMKYFLNSEFDYLASSNFDAQTMMGTLPIQHYVSEALDKHIKGIEKIIPHSGPKPLHVNFL